MENCDDLEYIRKYYKVPAHKYTKVLFQDNKYTIIGAYVGRLLVQGKDGGSLILHPTWNAIYLDENDNPIPIEK